jgi:hypothetical protein
MSGHIRADIKVSNVAMVSFGDVGREQVATG